MAGSLPALNSAPDLLELRGSAGSQTRANTLPSLAANFSLDRCCTSVMSAWFPWLLAFAVLVILPVALVLFAEDHPRRDDPPDSGDEEPVTALLAT